MLRIKKQQMDALAERDFVAITAAHLATFFPRHRVVAGETGLRQVARRALERTQRYGLVTARSATTFAELMCMLGAGFDEDPQLPWASSTLAELTTDEAARIDRLHAIAMRHLDEVAPDAARFEPAIAAVHAEPNTPIASVEDARARVADLVITHFPRRCAFLGTDGVDGVVERAIDRAEAHGASTARGAAALGGLAVALGSGFLDDPLVRPLGDALRDPRTTEAPLRVDGLLAALRRLATAWAGLS